MLTTYNFQSLACISVLFTRKLRYMIEKFSTFYFEWNKIRKKCRIEVCKYLKILSKIHQNLIFSSSVQILHIVSLFADVYLPNMLSTINHSWLIHKKIWFALRGEFCKHWQSLFNFSCDNVDQISWSFYSLIVCTFVCWLSIDYVYITISCGRFNSMNEK